MTPYPTEFPAHVEHQTPSPSQHKTGWVDYPAAPHGRGPTADVSTYVRLLLIEIPKSIVSVAIVWCLAHLVSAFGVLVIHGSSGGGFAEYVTFLITSMVVGCWIGIGGMCFYGRFANGVARWLLGLRPPTLKEQYRISGPWHRVLWRAGRNPCDYTIWIEDGNDINASAVGSGIVAITRTALEQLPLAQLEAILAHELGHHNLGHPRFLIAMVYFGQPAALIAKVLKSIVAVVVVMPVMFARNGNFQAMFGMGAVSLCCFGYALPFLAVIMGATIGTQALSRSSEFAADCYAADLGYGPALQELLRQWGQSGQDAVYAQMNFWEKLTSSHPPCYKRFQNLHTYMYSLRKA